MKILNRIKFVFISTSALLGLLITSVWHKLFRNEVKPQYLLRTFYFFGGLPGDLAAKFLKRKKNHVLKGTNFVIPSSKSLSEVKVNLDKKGFFVEENFIDTNSNKRILEYSLSCHGSYRKTDTDYQELTDVTFNRNQPLAVRFDYSPSNVLACSEIQRVLSDKRVLSVAQEYLGATPILDFVAMWWHAKSSQPDKNAAQYFHFDMDRLRWVKFFFYVTDVKSENGPHVFIPGTHRNFGIPFKLRKKGYVRFSDAEISKTFPESNWKTFTGNSGTMIVEDTRGLHKGSHVTDGDRLLFQFQFTSSLYGSAEEPDNMQIQRGILTKELDEAINKFPEIYQKISIL